MRVYEVDARAGVARGHGSTARRSRPLARYFGGFNVVVFTPEDLGAAARLARRPSAVPRPHGVQPASPSYLVTACRTTRRSCKQRNTVLKHGRAGRAAAAPASTSCSRSTTQQLAVWRSRSRSVPRARAARLARRRAGERVRGDHAHRARRRGPATCRSSSGCERVEQILGDAARGQGDGSRDASRRSSARIATTSCSSSTSATPALRIAGPAARDHARVEDRGARRARSRAHGDQPILLARRRVERARSGAQRVPVRAPRDARRAVLHHDHRMGATSCCTETRADYRIRSGEIPREFRQHDPFRTPGGDVVAKRSTGIASNG